MEEIQKKKNDSITKFKVFTQSFNFIQISSFLGNDIRGYDIMGTKFNLICQVFIWLVTQLEG